MPATATVTGLEFIILPSQDLKRATAFYQDVLGLEIDSKWREMGVEFELGDASVKDLQAKGVEFRDSIDSGVCKMAFFNDPDGNSLMLHHRYAP